MSGTFENPFVVAPEMWLEEGVPYGSFCKCCLCGRVERCFITFDFYADKPGDYLKCETCTTGMNPLVPQVLEQVMKEELP